MTREQLDRKKAALQHHYEQLQQCEHFYPADVERKRYAAYLREECHVMAQEQLLTVKEKTEELFRHYIRQDLFAKYWLLIEYLFSNRMTIDQFNERWACLQRQQEKVNEIP